MAWGKQGRQTVGDAATDKRRRRGGGQARWAAAAVLLVAACLPLAGCACNCSYKHARPPAQQEIAKPLESGALGGKTVYQMVVTLNPERPRAIVHRWPNQPERGLVYDIELVEVRGLNQVAICLDGRCLTAGKGEYFIGKGTHGLRLRTATQSNQIAVIEAWWSPEDGEQRAEN